MVTLAPRGGDEEWEKLEEIELWWGTPLTRVLGSRLKAYNLLQPSLIFLILSIDCRASPALSTLLTRTYLSANVVVL